MRMSKQLYPSEHSRTDRHTVAPRGLVALGPTRWPASCGVIQGSEILFRETAHSVPAALSQFANSRGDGQGDHSAGGDG